MSKYADRIRKKIRRVKLCKTCKERPRYLTFKRCLECQWKRTPHREVFDKTATHPGECHRCGKKSKNLKDWTWRDAEPKFLWCDECCATKFLIHLKRTQKEHQETLRYFEAVVAAERKAGIKSKVNRRAAAKLGFNRIKKQRSLAAEGNVPLMRRLLKEEKSDKEILKIFTELYKGQGKTDERWIKSRVKTYKRIVEEGEE